MLQEDDPHSQKNVQAVRSVNKNLPPTFVLPARPDEIFHIDICVNPETKEEFVLWEDILQAFDNAVQVRERTRVVSFLKGPDYRTLEPRRIDVVPNTVLDVIVNTPLTNTEVASPVVQQLGLQLLSNESNVDVKIDSLNVSPTSSAASSAPVIIHTIFSSTTTKARRNPVYGQEETAMDNYWHIDRPLDFSSARGPHGPLDDQTPTTRDLPVFERLDNGGNKLQSSEPQSATTDVPIEMDMAQTSISASQGNKYAQVALGDMYRDGKGVPQNYQAAKDWYLKAADQGHAAAQYSIGVLYDRGYGVFQDHAQAMDWYLKAAYQGLAVSQYNIGILYDNGQGVPQDHVRAMDWYLMAANQGHAFAQSAIGDLYVGDEGVLQDYEHAMDWYLKAANQGSASAQYNIGFLYDRGYGVPQDYAQAMNWYLKAANQGLAISQYSVGLLYYLGEGVPQNHGQARHWYQMAADQGDSSAKSMLQSMKSKDNVLLS
ncbi:hypothetical protein BG015_007706 [Linnemannia schmuckeri]|uniref:HCP-like protein n=1 Tax=Linnemannia schmuckeri TaxID=64567 RepID=A0A9P5S1J7_9FUNG|nr:hypothetical protein BG015_007706 [Linnemannia schmuckeri]